MGLSNPALESDLPSFARVLEAFARIGESAYAEIDSTTFQIGREINSHVQQGFADALI